MTLVNSIDDMNQKKGKGLRGRKYSLIVIETINTFIQEITI